jgi:hypothetical protein
VLRISTGSNIHQTREFTPEFIGNSGHLITGGWAGFKL